MERGEGEVRRGGGEEEGMRKGEREGRGGDIHITGFFCLRFTKDK